MIQRFTIRSGVLLMLLAVALTATVRLVEPPIVYPCGDGRVAAANMPAGSVAIEIPVMDRGAGDRLRGVFLEAGPAAPVVVHFLGSCRSITTYPALAAALHDLKSEGLSSLVVDYAGVGASDGAPSLDNMARDARAIWNEALRWTAGRQDMIFLRGVSAGTIPIAHLLADGAEPSGILLVAPVRGETVARNFARANIPGVGGLLSSIIRESRQVDVVRQLRDSTIPTRVYWSSDDELLPPDELALFDAVDVQRLPGTHLAVVNRSCELLPSELDFYRSAFAEAAADSILDRIERSLCRSDWQYFRAVWGGRSLGSIIDRDPLLSPDWIALAALAGLSPEEVESLRGWGKGRTLESRARCLDLEDPDGRLPLTVLPSWQRSIDRSVRPRSQLDLGADTLLSSLHVQQGRLYLSLTDGRRWASSWRIRPREDSGSPANATPRSVARRLARTLLKSAGIPDRLDPDTGALLAMSNGVWSPVEIGPIIEMVESLEGG